MTITLETEDVEEEIDEPGQTDLEIDKKLDTPIVTDDNVHSIISFEKIIFSNTLVKISSAKSDEIF